MWKEQTEPSEITPEQEYRCAINTINNLKEILNGAPLDSLSEEQLNDWELSMKIIKSYKIEMSKKAQQKSL